MNLAAIIAVLLAAGIASFLVGCAMALVERAKRPRSPKHVHNWDVYRETSVYLEGALNTLPIYALMTLRCTTCGEISVRKIK